MRIKRIFAANQREALRMVREQHGPDAVVISSRSVDGGVEVISAIDYDEDAVQAAARAQDPRANEIPPLEGAPGPRPGDPDKTGVGGAGAYSAPPPPPQEDEAARAREAALARLRSLRAGDSHRDPWWRPPAPIDDEPKTASAVSGSVPRSPIETARPRRLGRDDLAEPRGSRIDVRVGDSEEEDDELFAALSRDHQQSERQRVQLVAEKSRLQEQRKAAQGAPRSAGPSGPSRRPPETSSAALGAARQERVPQRKAKIEEDSALREMRDEIRTLRSLFESQLSLLEWGRMGRRHPARAGVIKRLADLGIGADVSRRLADHIGSDDDPNSAFRKALALIARHLPIAGDEIVTKGGVVALVGPTGVGKTTTVAKLAARYALRHGREKVALISTDNYRVGAQDQLLTYARILDVPVYSATNRHELRSVVEDLAGRGLVLIDTVGMSQRDVRLAEQFKTLGSAEGLVRTYLVLSAATQLSTLTESVSAFSGASPVGCIYTKIDEATTLGGALTCALRTRLPLAYLGLGQRVPEDLQAAKGDTLVHRACALLDEYGQGPDEEALALSLGGGAHVPE